MNIIKGNLITLALNKEFDVIAHGCNCFHTMGMGIAAQIREEFPTVARVDNMTKRADITKLGTYSIAFIPELSLRIANCYTQFRLGIPYAPETYQTRLNAIECCMFKLGAEFNGQRIGIPRIGAGLAGGSWNDILIVLKRVIPSATVVEL